MHFFLMCIKNPEHHMIMLTKCFYEEQSACLLHCLLKMSQARKQVVLDALNRNTDIRCHNPYGYMDQFFSFESVHELSFL